jgi:hypothetical protein
MTGFARLNDLSLNHGLTLLTEKQTAPLAPAARPMGVDAAQTMVIDERAGSQADRQLDAWLLDEVEIDPDLVLPSAFNQAFDGAREDLRQWLVDDRGSEAENTRTIKQCQRLLTEVRANLDLVHFYVNAIFKG